MWIGRVIRYHENWLGSLPFLVILIILILCMCPGGYPLGWRWIPCWRWAPWRKVLCKFNRGWMWRRFRCTNNFNKFTKRPNWNVITLLPFNASHHVLHILSQEHEVLFHDMKPCNKIIWQLRLQRTTLALRPHPSGLTSFTLLYGSLAWRDPILHYNVWLMLAWLQDANRKKNPPIPWKFACFPSKNSNSCTLLNSKKTTASMNLRGDLRHFTGPSLWGPMNQTLATSKLARLEK